ncbi:MAG: DUF4349 domain-containing protein [Clostridia bacterium]|nr:MAG: DUF4349 domain-containing protein [Clostridia bacterium]
MATCDWLVEDELSAYLDRELPAARTTEVEGHVAACVTCREALAGLQVVRDMLRTLPSVTPPPHLVATLQGRMSEVRRRQRVGAERRRVLWPLAGAAAAILLVVFSLNFLGPALVRHVAGNGQAGVTVALNEETRAGTGTDSVSRLDMDARLQGGGRTPGSQPPVAPGGGAVTSEGPGSDGAALPGRVGGNDKEGDKGAGQPQTKPTSEGEAAISGQAGGTPVTGPAAKGDGDSTGSVSREVTAAGVQEQRGAEPAAPVQTTVPVAHRASLTLQVNNPDVARNRIAAAAQTAGGRVEVSYTAAAGPVSVLVPPERFTETLETIKAVGVPVAVTVEEPDLSAQYQQTLSKLQSLEKEAASYRQQLQGGQGTAYVRQLLALVEQQKLAREQELKNLEEQFSWGVINITLQGREPAAPGR